MKVGKQQQGFTIVELLIVVVVIAILAAITIVSYNGITSQANDTAVQSDLRNVGMAAMQIQAESGEFPIPASNNVAPPGMENTKVNKNAYDSSANNFYYCVTTEKDRFTLSARAKSGKTWVYYSTGGIREYTATWSASASICPQTLGVASSTANYSFTYGQTASGSWFAWVK